MGVVCDHITHLFIPHQRNMAIESTWGCYAERAWEEHWHCMAICPRPLPIFQSYDKKLLGVT